MQKIHSLPRAILIDLVHPQVTKEDAAYRLAEARSLVDTYGGAIVVESIQKREHPDTKTYIGSGKVKEIAELAKKHDAELLIISGTVKPRQIFEIETQMRQLLKPKALMVWDRVDLILKIFAKHAATAEAKLQITLASIQHMGPRIYRMGMDLSRQAGGTGTRGGQGETNTEIMKRHLQQLTSTVKEKLDHCAKVRKNHRAGRERRGMKTVSIVGYTNAGKSSLLNALTRKGAYVADQLFATLDTRVAKLYLPDLKEEILLSDTIGFIQDLPPQLVQAFRSTLEETVQADLLLHVADASDSRWADKMAVVDGILAQLGAEGIPQLVVWNKTDLLKRGKKAPSPKGEARQQLAVSAHSGAGLEALKEAIQSNLTSAPHA